MTEFYVRLHAVSEVKQFVTAASLIPSDIDGSPGR